MTKTAIGQPPLVVHVIYRLAVGGLENGLVNLINRMPPERYRHAIVCIDDYTDFCKRIQRDDVEVYALHKQPGTDLSAYMRFWKLLRRLRPAIVHTRNLAALEYQIPAMFAGVQCRIQGEHGRDSSDIQGDNWKYLIVRRVMRLFVNRYIALSKDLSQWQVNSIHVDPGSICQIYNGVNTERFFPQDKRVELPNDVSFPRNGIVIGAIGRMQGEKDQLTLVKAFLKLLVSIKGARDRLRLVLIGDGPLRDEARALLHDANAEDLAWMPGTREDVSRILQGLDIFVLPSLIEGVSNTILEAMASGLPVVATHVGGNPELVVDGETGFLVPAANAEALAAAIQRYICNEELRRWHGLAGRNRVAEMFSMKKMVNNYMDVYDGACGCVIPAENPVSE